MWKCGNAFPKLFSNLKVCLIGEWSIGVVVHAGLSAVCLCNVSQLEMLTSGVSVSNFVFKKMNIV